MNERMKKALRTLACMLGAVCLMTTALPAVPAQAEDIYPGFYSVTVVPTYQNPDTGLMDDVGQNPGIGNMMVQAQVQPVGYVEITEDGTIWFNTRWNQADSNIYAEFETSSDGSQTWTYRDYEVTNMVEAGQYEFAGNTFDAVIVDYRFQLDSLSDTIRCTNFVEAMQRECIWFCYISEIYEGVGDDWNIVTPPNMSDFTESITPDSYEGAEPAAAEEAPEDEQAAKEEDVEKPALEDREVAEPKMDEKDIKETDVSDGIVGLEEEKDASEKETGSINSAMILIIGIIVGILLAVGIVCILNKKKKQSQVDLFSDVDEEK